MPVRFTEILRGSRDRIIAEWEEAVARAPSKSAFPMSLSGSALRNELPELLDGLSSWLTSAEEASAGMAVDLPARHALQRVEHAYQLHQFLEEFHALRAVILRRMLSEDTAETGQERAAILARLNSGLDRAVSVAVEAFVGEREKIRERFVGILGHDLRNPLNVILVSADSMIRSGNLAASFYPVVGRIARNAEQMKRMILDLLDLSRARLGQGISVKRARVQMGDLCRMVADDLRLAQPSRIITVDIEGELSGEWDHDRVVQAIGNLVSNAVKYGQDPVAISARAEDGTVIVTVSNAGPPIPPDRIATIFDPFQRGAEQPGRHEGLGLGLYIVSEIMRAHGGGVEVESSDEKGTTFTLRWPRSLDLE